MESKKTINNTYAKVSFALLRDSQFPNFVFFSARIIITAISTQIKANRTEKTSDTNNKDLAEIKSNS